MSTKPIEIKRDVYKVDATDVSLGRLASDIAHHLIGKHKPSYIPNVDSGDFIEVANIEKVKITGNKLEQKKYFRHSGYPGGLKTKVMREVFENDPKDVLIASVSRMLPKNKLRNERMKRLKIS